MSELKPHSVVGAAEAAALKEAIADGAKAITGQMIAAASKVDIAAAKFSEKPPGQ